MSNGPTYSKTDLKNAAEFLQTLKEVAKAQKEGASLTAKQQQALSDALNVYGSINEAQNQLNESWKSMQEARINESAELKEQIAMLEAQQSILEQHQKTFEDNVDLAETQKDLAKTQIDLIEDQYKLGKLSTNDYLDRLKTAKKSLGVADEKVKKLSQQANAAEKVGAAVAGVLGISRDTTPSFTENLVLMMRQEGTLKGLRKGFGGMKGVLDSIGNKGVEIFTMLIKKGIEFAIAARDLTIELRRATGMTEEFAQRAQNLHRRFINNAFSTDLLRENFSKLYSTVSEFSMSTPAVTDRLTILSAQASRAGVSIEQFAGATQFASKVMGESLPTASATALELGYFAKQIGLAPGAMIEAYKSVGPAVSAMGKGVTKEMKELARIHKVTGIEMQRLVAIGDQFDTFEGSAKAVGSLNAMLGGDFVNAIDLMMARSPSERFMMLKDSLDAAGKSFDTMSYYERKAIAGSLQLKDVGELAMIMNGNFGQLNKTAKFGTKDWEEYYKKQEELKTVKESLNAALARMAPQFERLIPLLEKALGYLTDPKNIENIKSLVKWMAVLKVAGFALGPAMTMAGQGVWKAAIPLGILALALGALAYLLFEKTFASNFLQGIVKFGIGLVGLGRASDASSPSIQRLVGPLLAVGAAVLMAMEGIALAAQGIATMVGAFNNLGEAAWPAAAAVGALMLGFVAFIALMPAIIALGGPAAPILMAIGGAVALIGLGIGIAAAGMSLFVESLAKLFDKVKPAELAIGIGMMAPAIAALATTSSMALLPVGALALEFIALGAGITAVAYALGKLKKLENFPNLQAAIVGKVLAVTTGGAGMVASAVSSTAKQGNQQSAAAAGPSNVTIQLDRQGTRDFLGGTPVTKEAFASRVFKGTGTGAG